MEQCDKISILGDRHRLRQLLLNLTDNQPQGTVKIGLRRVEEFAELKIVNTGPGIPAQIQDKLFDRFFRGDASHNNAVEGCGLGLSIVQWIVRAHQGTIQITSEPGKPTTVTVRLPLESGK